MTSFFFSHYYSKASNQIQRLDFSDTFSFFFESTFLEIIEQSNVSVQFYCQSADQQPSFLLYLALGNKTGLKKKKKLKIKNKKKRRKEQKRKEKKPEKSRKLYRRVTSTFPFLWQHLKVERIRLYLPSIKHNKEAIKIFRDKCPLSILSSLSQGQSPTYALSRYRDIIYFISVINFCITVL